MIADTDIRTSSDISLLVRQFYLKVRADDLLAPVFARVIREGEWETHLTRMCDFWETILLFHRTYTGDPLPKHLPLPIEKIHVDRWLNLFEETVDTLFLGKTAATAKRRAGTIAKLIMHAKHISLS